MAATTAGPARRATLWAAVMAVHAWTALLGVRWLRQESFFDVELYRTWVLDGLVHSSWPVLDVDWVYPVGALGPMLVVAPWAGSPGGYALAWAVLVTALDLAAVLLLLRTTPHGEVAVWWWLAAIVALGPVGMGRLEGVAVPLTVVALTLAARHPRTASAVLTVGAWLKVAPGVILLALAATSRRVWRDVVTPAGAVSGGVVVLALLGGAGMRVAGFLMTQTDRGLQAEAVAATPYSLSRLASPAVRAELDRALNTYEMVGADTTGLVRALDVALPVGIAAVTWLTWRAARASRGADHLGERPPADPSPTDRPTREAVRSPLLLGALALTLILVVLNKVGSPQYVAWLFPPVVVAVATRGRHRAWRVPAMVVLVTAALTQWLFPFGYPAFLEGAEPLVLVGASRNLLLLGLLGWTLRELWRDGGPAGPEGAHSSPTARTGAGGPSGPLLA